MNATPGPKHVFQDFAEFEAKVAAYFEEVGEGKPTIAGISYYLGFADKESFSSQAKRGPDWAHTVARARLRIESWLEGKLSDKNYATGGLIMALKNNYGWTDRSEHALTGLGGGPIETINRIELVAPSSANGNAPD